MKIKIQHIQTFGHNEGSSRRKVHSATCLHIKKDWRDLKNLTTQLKALEKKGEIMK